MNNARLRNLSAQSAQFAAFEGKSGGQFYTPSRVVRTLVEVLKPFENCRVYERILPLLIPFNVA